MPDDDLVLGPRPDGGPSPIEGICQASYDEMAEEIVRWSRVPLHRKLKAIERGIAQLRWSDRWAEKFRGP